jgi:acetyl esterase/lipase
MHPAAPLRIAAPIADWDAAYSNRAAVPEHGAFFTRWPVEAAAFRATARVKADLAYGPSARERYDWFEPAVPAKGLLIFIHGGYWMNFDKSFFSRFAAGALAHGWRVAIPSYDLCPAVRITEIGRQIARCVAACAAHASGPIVLAGHSAGGHLAALMACAEGPLAPELRSRLARIVGIGGLYDLRPLLRTAMNDTLRLDAAEAAGQSPALLTPVAGTTLVAWCGGAELPEFRRQNALIANVWRGMGAAVAVFEDPGRHHFDVLDALADPASPLCAAALPG